jgi:iron complex transport system substrate-binding protein
VTDLSGFRPNLEAIGGYEPDLVVLASDRDGAVGALENLGLPTLLLSSADSLDDVGSQIDTLGEATGHADDADRLAADLREELDEIAATARARDEPVRYFYELSDSLHSVTSESFIGELLGLAGMESIADGADPAAGAFPQLSNEYVLDADPDIVFLAHTDGTGLDPGEVAGRPGWSELRAVQDGHVVVLEPDVASRWGPRIVDLLREAIDATRELDG